MLFLNNLLTLKVPTDGAAAVILLLFLDVHNPRTPFLKGIRSIDWLGSITVAAATVMLLLGLQFGGVKYAWNSATVVCLIVFGILTFVLFFVTQFKLSPSPIMPFSIFSQVTNLSALAVCFFDAFVFNSVAYFLPLYFQTVLGASPLRSGVWMLAVAVPLALFSGCAGWIMEKTGRYLELLRGGLFLMTLGLGLCISFPDYISWPRIIVFLVIIGIGFGPNFHAPLIALQTHLEPKDVGAGTATFGFVRMLSGAFGVVLGQVLFQGQMQGHFNYLVDNGISKNDALLITKGSAIASSSSWGNNTAVRLAKTESFSKMWILYTVVSVLGLLASMGIAKKKLSSEHQEFKTGLNPANGAAGSDDGDSTLAEKRQRSHELV